MKDLVLTRRGVLLTTLSLMLLLPFLVAAQSIYPRRVLYIGGQAAEPTLATGEQITGRVIDDSNQPVPNASVVVARAGVVPAKPTNLFTSFRTVSTEENGTFVLDRLDRAAYSITALVPGLVDETIELDGGRIRYYRAGDSVNIKLIKGGVITGTVTDSRGQPLVEIPVRAIPLRRRTSRLSPVSFAKTLEDWRTDDRGVYRIYGLQPGTYVVAAGGSSGLPFSTDSYDGLAPTYYPSSGRDSAAELKVASGEEHRGIDIRFRELAGHTIEGTLSGEIPTAIDSGLIITLAHAATGALEGWKLALTFMGNKGFTFTGIADGQYMVAAVGPGRDDRLVASSPKRVTVSGADVTGIELSLMRLGSISGRVSLVRVTPEGPDSPCKDLVALRLADLVISAKSEESEKAPGSPMPELPLAILPSIPEGGVASSGEFSIKAVREGRYRLVADLPGSGWYIRAVTGTAATRGAKPTDLGAVGVAVRQGQIIEGIGVVVAEGAAGLGGRIETPSGTSVPPNMTVVITPAEPDSANDALRFIETGVREDGTFTFSNIAPGKYWVAGRIASEKEPLRPLAWDATLRAAIRRQAESSGLQVELKPCERLSDYVIRYPGVPSKPDRHK